MLRAVPYSLGPEATVVQTLTTLMALMLTILYVFNQQQHLLHAEWTLVRNEVMTQATSVAVDRLEEIGAMAFDEETVGGTSLTSAAQLTPAASFHVAVPPNDLSDFHGADVVRKRLVWEDSLSFAVQTTVAYAEEAAPDEEAAAPTKFKKVTVVVYPLNDVRADTVRLSQTFACGSLCAW